jgi:hypothetical protein
MRAFRGYSSITQQWARGCRTFHSLQLSFNRRFRDGLAFGFNDTIPLYDHEARVTGRNTTLSVASPIDATPANLPFDSSDNLVVARSLPKNAGFGVANTYQAPRTIQAQIRFSF